MSALLPLYRTLTALGAPAIAWYLGRRRAAGKEDAARFHERLGEARRPRPDGPLVWVHGASVGESLTMLPLVGRLLADHPALNVLVTSGTVSSAAILAERLPDRAFHQYVPVDRRPFVARFLDHWRPDLVLWAESEFWPNLVTLPAGRGIPLVLVNGRMSPDSFTGWQRYRGLIATMLAGFSRCLAQAETDAERLSALGAKDVRVTGNLKYAAPPLPADAGALATLTAQLGGRPVWLAASTHAGEEAAAAAAHKALKAVHGNLLTIIVPRHPDRGEAIAAELAAAGLTVARRSRSEPVEAATDVYLADTLGELGLFFRLCPVSFMGKSLVDLGGQNPLEPARLGSAVLAGPHMWNFPDITAGLIQAGAAETVADADALTAALGRHLADPELSAEAGRHGRAAAEAEAGVLDRVLAELGPFMAALGDERPGP